MSIELRVVLIVASLLTLVFITKKVRSSKVELDDSIFWFCFAGVLLVLSIFPQIFYFLSKLAGTQAPVNFVFLFFIFVLLILGFSLTMRISRMDTRLKELTQQLAIEKFERYNNDRAESLHELDRTAELKAVASLAPDAAPGEARDAAGSSAAPGGVMGAPQGK